jgi:hypothetical protein
MKREEQMMGRGVLMKEKEEKRSSDQHDHGQRNIEKKNSSEKRVVRLESFQNLITLLNQ